MQVLRLDAANVAAVAGIDLDKLALVDEERHSYGSTGLDCSRLECICCRIAFKSWLCVCDLENRLHRHFGIENGIG